MNKPPKPMSGHDRHLVKQELIANHQDFITKYLLNVYSFHIHITRETMKEILEKIIIPE